MHDALQVQHCYWRFKGGLEVRTSGPSHHLKNSVSTTQSPLWIG
jgi:hypothetical protein